MNFLKGYKRDEMNRSKQFSREMISMPPGNTWVAPPGDFSLTAESVEGKMCNFPGINSASSPNSKAKMQSGIAPSGSPGSADTLLASGTQET